MWMEMWVEMMGSWAGVASLAVILLSALAIPGAILWALMVQFKGPMERAHEVEKPAGQRTRLRRPGRYAH